MRGCFHFLRRHLSQSWTSLLLAFSCFLGFLLGMVFSRKIQADLVPVFRSFLSSDSDIGSFLLSLVFPFLLSAISASAGFYIFLLGICFGKAFLSGFFLFGLYLSAKLVNRVYFFSFLYCSAAFALLYWFCQCCLCSKSAPSLFKTFSFFLALLVFGLFFYNHLLPTAAWL